MQAMIFAAGLGTRLRPLTDTRPKALVEVAGKPLIQWNLEQLAQQGVRRFVVNIHHHAALLRAWLLEFGRGFSGEILLSDESDLLLDTGGGLAAARGLFEPNSEPFLVWNADVIAAIDIQAMMAAHRASGALATLAVQARTGSRAFLADAEGRLSGWRNLQTSAEIRCRPADPETAWGFSGVHCIDPALFALMPPERVFSITDLYLRLAADWPIRVYPHAGAWFDVGKPAALPLAAEFLRTGLFPQ